MASVFCMTVALRPTLVSGASMMPTLLHDKDVLITSPLATEFFQPTRGDTVTICLAASPLCGFIFSGAAQYVKIFRCDRQCVFLVKFAALAY